MTKSTIIAKPVKRQTMAEQMAGTIQELILGGDLQSGAALPTEPDLADQFGVSRAVVRDATRILMARGLVEVRHGRGVFVTPPINDSFGEALLLALRRANASAWDVEQFELILLPEIIALAAENVSDDEILGLRQQSENYQELLESHYNQWWGKEAPAAEQERLLEPFQDLLRAIYAASHNKLVEQLALPLLRLRNLRNWLDDENSSPDLYVTNEISFINSLIDAIASKDPDLARAMIAPLMTLPPEAITAMKDTPVGEVAEIPVPLPTPPTQKKSNQQ